MLGRFEIRLEPEIFPNFRIHIGDRLDQGQLINRLGIVSYGSIAVYSNGHRPHAQEPKGHQTESKDGRILHKLIQAA